MDCSLDFCQSISKKSKKIRINDNLKVDSWQIHFNNQLYGNCYYCQNHILIPKCVFHKLYPKYDITDYDLYIPSNITGTHFDHIHSEYNSGKTDINNIRPICTICNLKKNKKNCDEFVQSKSFTNNCEYNNDFMDIDHLENKCKGIIINKNYTARKCNNNSYIRNKCGIHMYQNLTY